jgi:hypothetical protein
MLRSNELRSAVVLALNLNASEHGNEPHGVPDTCYWGPLVWSALQALSERNLRCRGLAIAVSLYQAAIIALQVGNLAGSGLFQR